MNSIVKSLANLLVVLVIATVLSLIAACLVASTAHYNLGWTEDRSNAVGNTACTIVFIATWIVASIRK